MIHAAQVLRAGRDVFAGCWLCMWQGALRRGRGARAAAQRQADLHTCRSPRLPVDQRP